MATGTVEWVPDDQVSECPLCTRRFSTTKRKHHCRACGRVVCGSCSSNQIYLPSHRKEERVCDRCFDLLQHDKGVPMNESFLENKQLETSLKSDLREKQLQEEWFRGFLLKVRGDAGDASGSEQGPSSEAEQRALLAGARNRWTQACARAGKQKAETEALQTRVEALDRECAEKQEAIAKLTRSIKTMESTLALANWVSMSTSLSASRWIRQASKKKALSISPMSGVIGPDSSVTLSVNFKPLEERPFNFNVACNIKRKKEPVILNVKGLGYKIHASLAIEEPAGRRLINSGLMETLDMGMLQVHERRVVTLYLRNDSKRNFNYRVQMLVGANRKPKLIGNVEKPPYIALSNPQGVAQHHEETPIELTYAPRDAHMLDGSILQIAIPAGPVEETFSIALTGGAKRSRVEFSFLSHDFGPCFIARGGATMAGEPFAPSEDLRYERMELVATNRDDSDCLISTTFTREPWLDVQLNAAMIEAGGTLRIPIVFSPREVCEYMQRIEFVVNDYTRMHVDIRGRGCPLKLELTDTDMQNIDFGVTKGNEPVARQVRLVNRSPRPVTFELSDEKGELAQHAVSWTPAHPVTLRPRQTADVELRFNPTYRIAPFRLPLLAKCEHGVEVRLLHMSGTCHAIEMRLSEHSVFFGDVVVGSQATKPVRLHNFGDLGAKFRFEIGAKYSKIFSITPSEGFVRPQEDIPLTVAFHPTHDRIQEFKRGDKTRRGKSDSKDLGITARDIRCILEGHAPLTLEASGKCVSQPGETKLLEFTAQVRTKTQNSFIVSNPTETDWKLYPQVVTQEPAGTSYFSCEKEIVVPAKKDASVQVYYMPLTMTSAADTSPMSGKQRAEKHKGSIFVGTPDGNAVCYELEGEANAPEVGSRIEARVPCKKKHTQAVPVKNWLHERQRFNVTTELLEPAPDTPQGQGISLQGVGTLDLPPGLEREYRFSVYAYHEGTALVRINLRSQDTGEFMNIEVKLEFYAAESLATIKLEAACRQVVRHKIAVANPLMQPARFTGTASEHFFRFHPETLEVPPRSEKTMELIFRPLEEGDGEAEVMLKSEQLGTYPYTVNWRSTPAGLERALVLKAPLGGSVVESFKFLHYAKGAVKYSAKVEAAPGQKGPSMDFCLESAEVTAPAVTSEAQPVELGVRFQPSMLGECRAMLVITGAGGGEYKALLTGFAQPPQPQ
ncbi:Hydin, partial [Symbiodinium sp. CCMP2456]